VVVAKLDLAHAETRTDMMLQCAEDVEREARAGALANGKQRALEPAASSSPTGQRQVQIAVGLGFLVGSIIAMILWLLNG
jgi:hypothetical protein